MYMYVLQFLDQRGTNVSVRIHIPKNTCTWHHFSLTAEVVAMKRQSGVLETDNGGEVKGHEAVVSAAVTDVKDLESKV